MTACVSFGIISANFISHFLILHPMLLLIIQHLDLISIYVALRIFSIFLFSFLVILFSHGMIDIINRHLLAQDLLFYFNLLLHFYLKYEILFIRVLIMVKLVQFY